MTSTTFASATILPRARKDAVRIAVNAGIDMAMVPSSWDFCIYLRELVEEGQVSMERIDDAVSRVLRLKFRLGLFEKPFWNTGDFPEFASDEYAAVALQAAVESEVLLKNEGGLLPLGAVCTDTARGAECQFDALPQRRMVVFVAGRPL